MAEINEKKSNLGGKRPGAGRKKGGMNQATKDKKFAALLFERRVLKSVDKLFNAQVSLALGNSFLYRIDEIQEGKHSKKVHTLVTAPGEIKDYLDGNVDPSAYYYITTEKPDGRSIDSLLDRTFGKAVQKTDLGDESVQVLKTMADFLVALSSKK